MKNLCIALFLVVAFACTVFADGATTWQVQLFNNFSGGSGSVRYSPVVKLTYGNSYVYSMREVQVAGITAAGAFQNMSGHTLTGQCATTTSGPWATCAGVGGSAVTWANTATNGVQSVQQAWRGMSVYFRLAFTRAAKSSLNRISAWLTYGAN